MGIVVFLTLASGTVGYALGLIVKRPRMGALLGLLLGPIGWVALFLMPRHSQPSDRSPRR